MLSALLMLLSCGQRLSALDANLLFPDSCLPCFILQSSAWRELEGSKLSPWVTPPDPLRKAQRLREMEAARLRCRSALSPKIREQVCCQVAACLALSHVLQSAALLQWQR